LQSVARALLLQVTVRNVAEFVINQRKRRA
jgi:hypothetical protein